MSDPHLLIFGPGYVGAAVARAAAAAGFAVTLATRRAAPPPIPGTRSVPFADAAPAIAAATHLFSTVPPPGDGGVGEGTDPVLDAHAAAIAAASYLRWAGYCSTTGVYGDRAGGWVDEATPPAPGQDRSRRRLRAEQAWAALAARSAVDLFRIAGIYGPGRSPLDDVRAGRARRILRPGHVFCRIHRDDIVAAVLAAMRSASTPGVRILNLSDNEPAETSDVVAEAAHLLGLPPPPPVPFAAVEGQMSPMARSFWQECRRVASARTQAALGLAWRYPTFREGLRAILAAEGEHGPA
jgi:nucleoside-diphosphate-sugar epimerase